MPLSTTTRRRIASLALLASGVAAATGCGQADAARVGEAGDAAARVYVAPGKYDEFYAFFSGGFDGQIGVYGLPSGRGRPSVPADVMAAVTFARTHDLMVSVRGAATAWRDSQRATAA